MNLYRFMIFFILKIFSSKKRVGGFNKFIINIIYIFIYIYKFGFSDD